MIIATAVTAAATRTVAWVLVAALHNAVVHTQFSTSTSEVLSADEAPEDESPQS